MEFGPLLGVIGGMLLLGLCAWSYRGRSRAARWWSRPGVLWDDSVSEHLMLAVFPAFGLAALVGGGAEIISVTQPFRFVIGLVGLFAMFWGLWGILLFIPIPRWMMPRWYREMKPPKPKQKEPRPKEKRKQSPIDLWSPE